MPTRLGYNVNCEAPALDDNRQAAIDAVCGIQGGAHLLLDDYKSNYQFCRELYKRSPHSIRIHRHYLPKDENSGWDGSLIECPNGDTESKYMEGAWFARFLRGQQEAHNAPPNTVEQVFNEPDYHGQMLIRKNQFLVEAIEEASRIGLRLCVDNAQQRSVWFRDTSKTVNEVGRGLYDDLLRALARHPEHYFGLHSYGLGFLPANVSNAGIAQLTNPQSIGLNWVVDSDEVVKQQRALYVAKWPESQLCAATMALIQRCVNVLHIPAPKFIITEGGLDLVRLFEDGQVTQSITNINGREPMGYPTMYWYAKAIAPNWTRAEWMFEQLRWWDAVELPEVKGICIYTKDKTFMAGQYHVS